VAAGLALLVAIAWAVRRRLAGRRRVPRPTAAVVAALAVAVFVLFVGRPLAVPWRAWGAPLAPGAAAHVRLAIPADLPRPRAAELRIDLLAGRRAGCVVAVRVGGRPVAGAVDAPTESYFTDLRTAQRRDGAPLPAWYRVTLAADAIVPGAPLDVVVTVEGDARGGACATLFGDYGVARTDAYDGPSPVSPELLRDSSLHKYLVDGEYRMRRTWSVRPVGTPSWEAAGIESSDDLSPLPGRQSGRYRIFLLLDVDGSLVILG
jgi:hypothetical protein